MSLSYSKNYYIKKLLIQFISLLLLTFISSCHWNDLDFSKYFLEINREKRDSQSYNDYENFSRELKDLYEQRRSLKVDKGREIVKNDWGYGNLYTYLFKDKKVYESTAEGKSEYAIRELLESEYEEIKKYREELENLNKNDKIDDSKLKHIASYLGTFQCFHCFHCFYFNTTCYIIPYKKRLGSAKLKEFYKDFDILFIKESLARVTKIRILRTIAIDNFR